MMHTPYPQSAHDTQTLNFVRYWLAMVVGSVWVCSFRIFINAGHVFRRKKITLAALAIALALSSLVSLAVVKGPGLPTTSGSSTSSKDTLVYGSGAETFDRIAGGLQKKLDALKTSSALKSYGTQILVAGSLITFLWGCIGLLVAGKGLGDLIGILVPIAMAAFVSSVFLTSFSTNASTNGASQTNGGMLIDESMTRIANAVTSSMSGPDASAIDTGSIPSVIKGSWNATYVAVANIWNMKIQTEYSANPLSWFTTTMSAIAYLIAATLLTLIILLSMVTYMATAIMALMSLSLVLALAPVMVPFISFAATTWIFDSWLKFLLGACMLKLVGAFMLGITASILAEVSRVSVAIGAEQHAGWLGPGSDYVTDMIQYAILMVVSLLSGLLMSQTPSIAMGLLSGSAGGAGFKGISAVTQSTGFKAASATAGAAADKMPGLGREARATKTAMRDKAAGTSSGGAEFKSPRAKAAYMREINKKPPNKPKPEYRD